MSLGSFERIDCIGENEVFGTVSTTASVKQVNPGSNPPLGLTVEQGVLEAGNAGMDPPERIKPLMQNSGATAATETFSGLRRKDTRFLPQRYYKANRREDRQALRQRVNRKFRREFLSAR
jgi:hypothetical protein